MDTKDAVLKGTQLRAKLAAKQREQHMNAVTALFNMGTTLTVGAPGEHCKLHCKRMRVADSSVVDRDVPVTLWNISKQKLVTDNLPEDHELRVNPPRTALIEVEDAKGVHWTLAGRINLCRQRHKGQAPWPWESEPLLELEAFVAMQSRGLPLAYSASSSAETAWMNSVKTALSSAASRAALTWGEAAPSRAV